MSGRLADLVLTDLVDLDDRRTWVAITDGHVSAVGDGDAPPAALEQRSLGDRLVVPGFVSAHQHSMDRSARGMPIGATFSDWLLGVYYGTALALSPPEAGDAARRTARELLAAGVTTVVDCWGVGDIGSDRAMAAANATVDAYREVGIRLILAVMVGDVEPTWLADAPARRDVTGRMVADTGTCVDFVRQLVERHHAPDAGVEVWPAPELPEMATDALWLGCARLARDHGLRIATHLHASPGTHAVERLARLGVLDLVVGAHCSHVTADDVDRLAGAGASAVHCPTASLALGGPPTPIVELSAAGVAVGLGLDNPSLTATADVLHEARLAVGLARMVGERFSPDPEWGLDLATTGGAAALGRPDLGRLAPGCVADFVVVDRSGPHWWPELPARRGLAVQATATDLAEVWVAGRRLHPE